MLTQSELNLAPLNDYLLPFIPKFDYFSFPKLIAKLSELLEEGARMLIIKYIERMDYNFRYSNNRSDFYYVKDYRPRTVICMYGEITYYRTIYRDLYNNRNYCYVDEKLGIDKYIRYTNDVAAYVYDAYSDENSMIKVGKEIGSLIKSKFSLMNSDYFSLPRQTIYNLIKRVPPIEVLSISSSKINDIYLLFDEKYIPCQDKIIDNYKRNNIMVKSCLIVEGLDASNKKRHKYVSPHYISYSGDSKEFIRKIEDYLISKYDTDKINNIHILSDGGSWIKSVGDDLIFPRIKKIRYLDKFHAFKALWSIALDNDLYESLIKTLFTSTRKEFFNTLKGLKDVYPERKAVIEEKTKYIKSHYEEIKRILKLKNMNCAMEQVISHHLASEFTSVPKAYSSNNINRYLSMRDNKRNNLNLKELFLKALGSSLDETFIINKLTVDQSLFNGTFIPCTITNIKTTRQNANNNDDPGCEYYDQND